MEELLQGNSSIEAFIEDGKIKIAVNSTPVVSAYLVLKTVKAIVSNEGINLDSKEVLIEAIIGNLEILKNELKGDN